MWCKERVLQDYEWRGQGTCKTLPKDEEVDCQSGARQATIGHGEGIGHDTNLTRTAMGMEKGG